MKLIIEAEPKEIADLVLAVQGRSDRKSSPKELLDESFRAVFSQNKEE